MKTNTPAPNCHAIYLGKNVFKEYDHINPKFNRVGFENLHCFLAIIDPYNKKYEIIFARVFHKNSLNVGEVGIIDQLSYGKENYLNQIDIKTFRVIRKKWTMIITETFQESDPNIIYAGMILERNGYTSKPNCIEKLKQGFEQNNISVFDYSWLIARFGQIFELEYLSSTNWIGQIYLLDYLLSKDPKLAEKYFEQNFLSLLRNISKLYAQKDFRFQNSKFNWIDLIRLELALKNNKADNAAQIAESILGSRGNVLKLLTSRIHNPQPILFSEPDFHSKEANDFLRTKFLREHNGDFSDLKFGT